MDGVCNYKNLHSDILTEVTSLHLSFNYGLFCTSTCLALWTNFTVHVLNSMLIF